MRFSARELGTLALALMACLIVGELVLRVAAGVPVLPTRNLIKDRVDLLRAQSLVNEHDPLVGWRLKPNFSNGSADPHSAFTTGPLGERRHSNAPLGTPDAVLAVGDSFTAGSEVGDTESWPAALERLSGHPVVNGAAGGYGADQIVLRAEQLASTLHPHAVIVSLLYDDIGRAGLEIYGGGAKPWFSVERVAGADPARGDAPTALVLHGVPVPPPDRRDVGLGPARSVLGWSAIADRLAMRFWPAWWQSPPYVYSGTDAAAVTCLLLRRVAALPRPTLLLQWGGNHISKWPNRPVDARKLLRCARALGLPTLDLWDGLKVELAAGRLDPLYVMHGVDHGHMSAAGNEWVAWRLLPAVLGAAAEAR